MDSRTSAHLQRKRLENILEDLDGGIVVVEGKHDVETLERLGIKAIPYQKLMKTEEGLDAVRQRRKFYVMMDADKGGEDKERKTVDQILRLDPYASYDTNTARRFLGMLGITSVEQAYGRVMEILSRE